MNDTPDEFRDWDAAYVLGALGPDDRRAYEQHLTSCPACAAAVAELAGMPGLLRKLSPEDAEALTTVLDDGHLRGQQHEPGLVQRLATTANKRRRRVRATAAALMVGAAAILAFGGIFIGASLAPSANVAESPATNAPTGTAVMMTPVQPGTMTATLTVSSKAWGTRFDWTCNYENVNGQSSAAKTYSMVMTDTSGVETVIATWSATQKPRATELATSSSTATSKIRRIEIRAVETNTPLVGVNL
jgi:hypothetical protein